MSSIVFFHAHPDDEALATGGTIAKLADTGHKVTLVFATRGEVGEVPNDFLAPDTTLGQTREAEARKAAEILGAGRIDFLGYRDSGMENEVKEDSSSEAFCNAAPDEAAARLAKILDEVNADILTTYDPNGGYGHPDHIQVHRVGNQAAQLAQKSPQIFWATMNRDHFQRLGEENQEVKAAIEEQQEDQETDEAEMQDRLENNFGWPEAEITHTIDVLDYLNQKVKSLKAHASQITEDSFFMKLSDDTVAATLGAEWFVQPETKPGETKITSLL